MTPGEEPREPAASPDLQSLLSLVDQPERKRHITWVGDCLASGDRPDYPAALLGREAPPRAGPLVVMGLQRSEGR